jgi:hypothetical protein
LSSTGDEADGADDTDDAAGGGEDDAGDGVVTIPAVAAAVLGTDAVELELVGTDDAEAFDLSPPSAPTSSAMIMKHPKPPKPKATGTIQAFFAGVLAISFLALIPR